jgi:hypothetical protein
LDGVLAANQRDIPYAITIENPFSNHQSWRRERHPAAIFFGIIRAGGENAIQRRFYVV